MQSWSSFTHPLKQRSACEAPTHTNWFTGGPLFFSPTMTILLNARDLTDRQKSRIEKYFEENFAYDGNRAVLIWEADQSDRMLLNQGRDFASVAVALHESNLMELAGRGFLQLA